MILAQTTDQLLLWAALSDAFRVLFSSMLNTLQVHLSNDRLVRSACLAAPVLTIERPVALFSLGLVWEDESANTARPIGVSSCALFLDVPTLFCSPCAPSKVDSSPLELSSEDESSFSAVGGGRITTC